MSQNVAQWLAEIQSLQRQVTMLQQEREQAYGSVKSWRDLYEGEAKQRQRDATTHARKIKQLESAIQKLQGQAPTETSDDDGAEHSSAGAQPISKQLEADIAAIKNMRSVEQLQVQLIAARRQNEHLKHQITAEQEEHEKTRESLTAALSDAVDLLAKERAFKGETPSA
ncbi:MAG: hypothetical protein AAF810_09425 [Cyanobacteria bacterium P01_D01_bin.36]